MTSKAIFYHSLTGNTEAILDGMNKDGYDVFKIESDERYDLENYDIILIGMSTYGRGVPHKETWNFARQVVKVRDRKIALFGSGNSIYPDFCGSLDLMEKELSKRNEILFKYKFEAYPTSKAKEEFKQLFERI